MSTRTRRNAEKKTVDRFAALKAARSGQRSRLAAYESKNEELIYDEVDEEDYQNHVRDRINNDDFVVDDDGRGYVDNGMDDWDEEHSEDYSDDDQDADRSSKKKSKGDKAEREETKRKIDTFFLRNVTNKPTAPKAKADVKEADSFFDALMNEFETEATENSKPRNERSRRPLPATPTPQRSIAHSGLPSPRQSDTLMTPVPKRRLPRSYVDSPNKKPAYSPEPETIPDLSNDLEPVPEPQDVSDDDIVMEFDPEPVKAAATPPEEDKEDMPTLSVRKLNIRARDRNDPEPVKYTPPKPVVPTANVETFAANNASPGVLPTTSIPSSAILDVLESDGTLRLWWFDAYERNGSLYLFGKVCDKKTNNYVSCCLTIKQTDRSIFVLPRPFRLDKDGKQTDKPVDIIEDVYAEFDAVCSRYKITKWAAKEVTRKYAFETPGIPAEGQWLKVVYSFELPTLPAELTGETFSHVFGTQTSALELFLIKRNIMGPCWLEIKNAEISQKNASVISWARCEAVVSDVKSIKPYIEGPSEPALAVPPLTCMSLNLKTVMNHQKHANEIVLGSALVFPDLRIDDVVPIEELPKQQYTVVRQLNDIPYPVGFVDTLHKQNIKVEVSKSERALLNYLLAIIHRVDPDVIVGHNFMGFDLDVLLHRMKDLKVDHWSRMGRLRRTQWPKLQAGAGGAGEATYSEKMIMSGRLMCDTYMTSKDLIKSKSYSLSQLSSSQLNIIRENIEFDKIPQYYSNSRELIHLIRHCEFDAFLAAALMFKLQMLPLTKQLTNLAGNTWSRTMTGARAERNEYLLLHEFHNNKFVCPDKTFNPKVTPVDIGMGDDDDDEPKEVKKTGRRKPAYIGGLVLEPKKGFYDRFVLLLDFNSLYPSIIQEYNICFTTVERRNMTASLTLNLANEEEGDLIPDVPDSTLAPGILPRLIKALVERRRQVKSLMKNPKLKQAEYAQYNVRQQALKLTANSMYGCLGFAHSRFYCKPMAMLITSKGREILQNTVDLAESQNLNVIYGDTDSIMVYTNENDINAVKDIGNMLKKKVNERYNLLEIDIDGLFRHMLLLKKKKYAALVVEEKDGQLVESMETKGLDLVRRDWCGISHDVSEVVLKIILSDSDREEVVDRIHTYLRDIGQEVRDGMVPLEKFVINKGLTKAPEDYADGKSQPHVQVALKMRAKGQSVRAGDTIPYVICTGDGVPQNTKSFAERAFHPDDVKLENGITIDIEWYLHQQVHPPVARLCEPMEGTDTARLASCLGLDPSKYRSVHAKSNDSELVTLDSQISDAERFKDAEPFVVQCTGCCATAPFKGICRTENNTVVSGLECPTCHTAYNLSALKCQLTMAIRRNIDRYYTGWISCDDSSCNYRTRMLGVYGKRCLAPGCRGVARYEYSDTQLYHQLLYYASLFDPEKIIRQAPDHLTEKTTAMISHLSFSPLSHTIQSYLVHCGRRYVQLAKLFPEPLSA